MIVGIHHTAISTPDLERLQDFYCGQFGLREVGRGGWPRGTAAADELVGLGDSEARFVYLRGANALLELFEFASPEPSPRDPARRVCDHGLTHICFEVSEIDEEYARLRAGGVAFRSAPVDTGEMRVAYAADPDGNVVELIEFHPVGADRRVSPCALAAEMDPEAGRAMG